MMSDYIRTYTGKKMHPLDPQQDEIDLRDIAHALSMESRFSGHTSSFYSVAEHSVRVADIVPREYEPWALLHDASEAYLRDIPRPLKHSKAFEAFRAAEERLMRVIACKYGLTWPEPDVVHWADDILLVTEMRDLMGGHPEDMRGSSAIPLTDRIIPWSMEDAKYRWWYRVSVALAHDEFAFGPVS